MGLILNLFLLVFFLSADVFATRYACTTDQKFQDWLNQLPVDITNDTELVKYSDISSCKSQCRETQTCVTNTTSTGGYTCPLFDMNTDLGVHDDLGRNAFSSQNSCNNSCYIQNSCIAWTDEAKCYPISFDKSNPVSDYTGKTVFTRYTINWNCESSSTNHGECLAYKTTRIDDNTTFDLSKIGWKSKRFSEGEEALVAVSEMEQFQHIWSGWNGMCERGIKMDNSWMSDPMTILSFASMAYTGALDGAYGTAAESASQSVKNSFDNMTTLGSASTTTVDTGQSITNTSSSVMQSASDTFQSIKSTYSTVVFPATTVSGAVTYGSLVMNAAVITAAALSEPSDNDLDTAQDYMNAQLGVSSASIAAVNYSQCMASIGLSFPNMMGFSVDSNESMSSDLREPWKNQISLSDEQLASLMEATSVSFVKGSYFMLTHQNNIGHYIATSAIAYTQAGQVICGGGTIAKAINVNNQIATDNSGGGGINAEAMASAALGQALGYLPPPYNLMASIALKVLTSVSEGNACTDEDLAMSWGPQQYKTNKALKFSQCHDVDSACVAKLFGTTCIRRAYYQCCYDQEITKIFVEGVKAQLGESWTRNECDDIEISDLKEVSFRKCLNNENPVSNKCFPQDSWLALNIAIKKQAVKGFDANSLSNMAIDAMPIGNDPWGPRVGD